MLELNAVALAIGGRPLIAPFSLSLAAGELACLMGPSGSGKSSILSYIGGDLDPAITGSGTVTLNGRLLNGLAPEHRGIGRLFQDDLLFPHLTVGENLFYATPSLPRADKWRMVDKSLLQIELAGFRGRPPHTLSGGQRARVALMRSLLAKPGAILLDEPFSKLDHELRQQIRDYTFAHIAERGIPALMVTHDRSDAPPRARILQITKSGEVIHV